MQNLIINILNKIIKVRHKVKYVLNSNHLPLDIVN